MTLPNGDAPPGERPSELYYGSHGLFTALWPDGIVVFEPGGPGEIRPDGSLAIKYPWWRDEGIEGELIIEGRRLDGPAPPLQAEIPEGYGGTGFQASAVVFPTEGCWEVTGRAGPAELTFVVKVSKAGNGT